MRYITNCNTGGLSENTHFHAHIRVDDNIKAQATKALTAMCLSMSDAVRLFLCHVIVDQAFPLELKVPNA